MSTTTFQELHDAMMQDPQFREAYEDAETLASLRDSLVSVRKAQRISQKEVARRMGVGQSTVSEFETSANDPRISTLQRYARAVTAQLKLGLDMPCESAWTQSATAERWESNRRRVALTSGVSSVSVSLRESTSAEHWARARSARRDDFVLSA